MKHAYVAIMAGGIGSRFWPASREETPKQFLDILGTGQSLLKSTFDRFKKIVPLSNIYILTNERYRDLVKKQLPKLKDDQIIGEPMRRNTAPCVAYFAFKIQQLDPQAQLIIAPSDHLVLKPKEFRKTIKTAVYYTAGNDDLVTLGIRPVRPDTGYGYIQYLDDSEEGGTYRVKTFTEKPGLSLAKTFLESGDFLWNSGIFIWKAKTILESFEKHLPEIYDNFFRGIDKYNSEKEASFIKKAYSTCPNISIDFGIMEKANNVRVIPASFGWSDLGTWSSLYEHYEKDYYSNAVSGKRVMVYDAANCMVMAPDDKLVVLQGLDNYIIVDTEDVLLIFEKTEEQKIKEITDDIKRKKLGKFL